MSGKEKPKGDECEQFSQSFSVKQRQTGFGQTGCFGNLRDACKCDEPRLKNKLQNDRVMKVREHMFRWLCCQVLDMSA